MEAELKERFEAYVVDLENKNKPAEPNVSSVRLIEELVELLKNEDIEYVRHLKQQGVKGYINDIKFEVYAGEHFWQFETYPEFLSEDQSKVLSYISMIRWDDKKLYRDLAADIHYTREMIPLGDCTAEDILNKIKELVN